MPKIVFYLLLGLVSWGSSACSGRPSKVDLMRAEKAQRDSIAYCQAKQNLHYSDSLLQLLLPQTDPLLRSFVYSKNEKAEDHGHYVHRSLQTTSNTTRNFLQAYVSDNRIASVQSYYYGSRQQHQRALRLTIGEDYINKEGSNHAFNVEGWHEILTIEGDDAIQLLSFIANHTDDRIRVSSIGDQQVVYYLTSSEKQALADTYRLSVLMRDIDALERAIHVASLQIQKYEKKRTLSK